MKKSMLLIYFICLLTACVKKLEEHPKSTAAEVFYNTPGEVEAGLNAVYIPVRRVSTIGALYLCQQEIYTEYLYGRGSHAPLNDYNGLDNTNVTRINSMWTDFYESIRDANIVLQKAPAGKSLTADDLKKYLGEARFLRALCYFYLVRNWSGVPLRTELNLDSINLPKSSAAAVYELIVTDLEWAAQNLPDNPRLVGAPSAWSAKAVLTDVYMHLQQYDKARDNALDIINSGKFSLVKVSVAADFDKLFGPDIATSTEEIFYFKYARTPAGQGFSYPQYAHYPNSGYYPPGGYYTFYSDAEQNSFVKNWDKNDLRYTYCWYAQTFGLGSTTLLLKKFSDKSAVTAGGNDYPAYRYADILLFYAEAATQAAGSPSIQAMEMLNRVHRRAYGKDPLTPDAGTDLALSDYADKQSFINRVVQERGYENCGEGKRWLDLKRLGIAAQVIANVKGKTITERHMLWPIPTVEYNYNTAIHPTTDQNPGY